MINNIVKIYFSPTDTTRTVINEIVSGLRVQRSRTINLTMPEVRSTFDSDLYNDDMIIIGVPVYEEKIPEIVEEPLGKLKGQGQPAILVVLYGNVGFGIALKQLDTLVTKAGFDIVGAASFIGEHSFSNQELEIAKGRPDAHDLKIARSFGEKIARKINQLEDIKQNRKIEIEGKIPLFANILPRNSAKLFAKKPEVDNKQCNQCGICINICPVRAIDDKFKINDELCLRCFACVRKCPEKARQINFKKKLLVKNFLKVKTKNRKEPCIYL